MPVAVFVLQKGAPWTYICSKEESQIIDVQRSIVDLFVTLPEPEFTWSFWSSPSVINNISWLHNSEHSVSLVFIMVKVIFYNVTNYIE